MWVVIIKQRRHREAAELSLRGALLATWQLAVAIQLLRLFCFSSPLFSQIALTVYFLKDPRMIKFPAIYIMASKPKGTLYTGVTSDLIKRIYQHKNAVMLGFTERYTL
jgi:hypothetical protein